MPDFKKIARTITVIENHLEGYENILLHLPQINSTPVIGVTGPPGSGKSTITDKLIKEIVNQNKTVAVLCIDPSSPFNMGALLGDRIRMSAWYTHEKVFIRSLASRKALGGLSPMIIEITEYLKTTGFDFIVIETVGVGQTEIDIAGLADVTIVNLTPGTGDEIQTMKSGIIEIADIFVVNKSDKPGADILVKNLHSLLALHALQNKIPIIKTKAEEGAGIHELYHAILKKLESSIGSEKKYWLYAEKVHRIIMEKKMKNIRIEDIAEKIKSELQNKKNFNPYLFAKEYLAD